MCLIRCHVRINGTLSGPGVPRGPGHHHGTHRHAVRCHRIRRAERGICTDTWGAETGGTVLTAHPRSPDGVQPCSIDHRPAAADYQSSDEAVTLPAMRQNQVRAANTDSDGRTGRGQKETCATRIKQGASTTTGGHDPAHTAIWRGSPWFEDRVSECSNVGSEGGSGGPVAPKVRRQRFPDSPDCSGSDWTQLRGWIAQLRMVKRYKPTSFPDEQSMMRYTFNHLSRVAVGLILPHVQEDGTIWLQDLPAFIQLLQAATANRNTQEIK